MIAAGLYGVGDGLQRLAPMVGNAGIHLAFGLSNLGRRLKVAADRFHEAQSHALSKEQA